MNTAIELDSGRLVPEYIRQFQPYIPSKPDEELRKLYGCRVLHRLHNNENPLGPPTAARRIFHEARPESAALYPSGDCYALRMALARRFSKHPDQFLVGNGSCEVITSVIKAFCEKGDNIITATIGFEQYIGQHNQGNHTALYGDVNSYLAGKDVPIPIVGPGTPDCAPPQQAHQDGCFKGWAMFHVISAAGGSSKTITGYFLTNFIRQPLTVGECTAAMQAAGTCGRIPDDSAFGAYAVRLSD